MKFTITVEASNEAELRQVTDKLLGRLPSVVQESIQVFAYNDDELLDKITGGELPEGTLDAEGLPWDERIHSAGRRMTGKGIWHRRKNTPDDVFNAVRSELSQRSVAPVQPPVSLEYGTPAAAVPEYAPVPQYAAPAPQYTPPAVPTVPEYTPAPQYTPPVPVPQYAPAPTPVEAVTPTYDSIINRINDGVNAGTYKVENIPALMQQLGVQNIPQIKDDINKINLASQILTSLGV